MLKYGQFDVCMECGKHLPKGELAKHMKTCTARLKTQEPNEWLEAKLAEEKLKNEKKQKTEVFSKMSLPVLKTLAKELGVAIHGTMGKPQIIEALAMAEIEEEQEEDNEKPKKAKKNKKDNKKEEPFE